MANGQAVKVAEKISENELALLKNQKLLVIDFWASWCAPCIPATRQMEIYQERYKDDIYFIALSDEYYGTITNHLKRHPIKLAVYQDADNFTFEKYQVKARPHVAVLNSQGRLVWDGKPGDLSIEKLDHWLRKEQKRQTEHLASLIEVQSSPEFLSEEVVVDNLEVDLCGGDCTAHLDIHEEYVAFQGKLSALMAKLYGVSSFEVIMEYPDVDIQAKVPISPWRNDPESIAKQISAQFGFEVSEVTREMDFQELVPTVPDKLWDNAQINWGNVDNRVLIGTSRIEADDLSIRELAVLLSLQKQTLFKYSGDDKSPRDWDFHYKYDDLMKNELWDQFGIEVRNRRAAIPVVLVN